jgi:hypothetical protein
MNGPYCIFFHSYRREAVIREKKMIHAARAYNASPYPVGAGVFDYVVFSMIYAPLVEILRECGARPVLWAPSLNHLTHLLQVPTNAFNIYGKPEYPFT